MLEFFEHPIVIPLWLTVILPFIIAVAGGIVRNKLSKHNAPQPSNTDLQRQLDAAKFDLAKRDAVIATMTTNSAKNASEISLTRTQLKDLKSTLDVAAKRELSTFELQSQISSREAEMREKQKRIDELEAVQSDQSKRLGVCPRNR